MSCVLARDPQHWWGPPTTDYHKHYSDFDDLYRPRLCENLQWGQRIVEAFQNNCRRFKSRLHWGRVQAVDRGEWILEGESEDQLGALEDVALDYWHQQISRIGTKWRFGGRQPAGCRLQVHTEASYQPGWDRWVQEEANQNLRTDNLRV